jgi:hypothetical protein
VIKHGKIHPIIDAHVPHSHLDPIKEYITKGIADARENVVLQPMACDVKGAKRHNPQQCVIAKALKRIHHPQAVAVGRSLAYVVMNGLAIRFSLPVNSRKLVEEFDQRGRARNAPVTLAAPCSSWKLRAKRDRDVLEKNEKKTKRARTRKIGVRAIGGGISARA